MKSSSDIQTALKSVGVQGIDPKVILKTALARGGSLAELFFEETESTRITVVSGKIDQIVEGIDRGVGLRIIYDNRSVYGYSTDLTQKSLEDLAMALSQAVENSEKKSDQIPNDFRSPSQPNTEILNYQIKKDARTIPLSEKIKMAFRGDAGARKVFPGAVQVTAAHLDTRRKMVVVNSDGTIAQDQKNYMTYFIQVLGQKDGRYESSHEGEGGYYGWEFWDQFTPEEIAERCANRVKTLLQAKPAPSGKLPVVLSAEAGGTMIHEAVGHGLEADLACNGLSVYQNKIGQQVASPLITVIDDGTMVEKRGSYAYDDEGNPSKKTVLIENGILKAYLSDRLSAMKFDIEPTGNGRRETFRHRPIVRMTNTYIAPGNEEPASIVANTKWGVFVKSMGGGQVNTVTGDFVFAVTEAYLIRDGKLGEPIRGATLVGNGPEVLKMIDKVGNDLGYAIGTCGKDGQGAPVTDAQPTLRIPEITLGGEVPITHYWS